MTFCFLTIALVPGPVLLTPITTVTSHIVAHIISSTVTTRGVTVTAVVVGRTNFNIRKKSTRRHNYLFYLSMKNAKLVTATILNGNDRFFLHIMTCTWAIYFWAKSTQTNKSYHHTLVSSNDVYIH